MASLELPCKQIIVDNHIPMYEPQTLDDVLNQFVGEPNTEVTRAAIQSILWRYNFVYNEHLTIEDLNIF